MHSAITSTLIAELWEASPASGEPCIGYDVASKGYRVAPGRFVAEAHLVITQDELHGRTVTGSTGHPALYDELACEIDDEEPARCEVCGSKSKMPMGWPCEDCLEAQEAVR